MTAALAHRTPDDRGGLVVPVDDGHCAARFVGLGHRRLSIIDLSRAGRQPMRSPDGRTSVVFNGEIYNYRDLRHELIGAGYHFVSKTDTEILVHGWTHWGRGLLERLNSMFAIAIRDARRGELVLVRDRVGIKPLYLYQSGELLLFASELTGLHAHPEFPARIDAEALALFLEFPYVPSPRSIYQDTRKVLPGKLVRWRSGLLESEIWWHPLARPLDSTGGPLRTHSVAESTGAGIHTAARTRTEWTDRSVTARCGELLRDAVSRRLVGDVPVGAFLSGGIDSSLVVATAQQCAGRPIDTFSVGFDDPRYNETPFARAVAEHLGTRHHELIVTPSAARETIDDLAGLYDEPLGDPSALPTLLVSRFARALIESSRFHTLFGSFFPMETANILSLVDIRTYLVDDILAKVDRASMAVALEVRVPLPDHRLVGFAVSLRASHKARHGRGKLPLRALAAPLFPAQACSSAPGRDLGYPPKTGCADLCVGTSKRRSTPGALPTTGCSIQHAQSACSTDFSMAPRAVRD